MAIAEDYPPGLMVNESGRARAELDRQVRVAVHDASRIEWSLSLPLPVDKPLDYLLSVEIRIPQNAFVRHSPWDQMQAFTRLDGPAIAVSAANANAHVTIDHLRRSALAMASQLSRASDGFARHCRLAGSLFATAPHRDLEDALAIWIEAAMRIVEEAREKLGRDLEGEGAELARERDLVDEYVSVRFLEMLASAQKQLAGILCSKTPHAAKLAPVIALVDNRIADALGTELVYRASQGFANADAASPEALEHYVARASRLKKHFQEVLFLEPETFEVAQRAYHWIAAFVAVVASMWAFAWQLALTRHANAAQTVSSGVLALAVVAGLVYATKDRIKEIGRAWMTRRVHRMWGAQRITRYRAPARRLPGRDIVVSARESFSQKICEVTDVLNPSAGSTQNESVLTYENRGAVMPHAKLVATGVRRVKHVFRYDLSPIFARLDDAMKQVPVLCGETKKVRFIDAPRCYRVPITVRVSCDGERIERLATLVLHKRGLERLERADEQDSGPSLPDISIEPA